MTDCTYLWQHQKRKTHFRIRMTFMQSVDVSMAVTGVSTIQYKYVSVAVANKT